MSYARIRVRVHSAREFRYAEWQCDSCYINTEDLIPGQFMSSAQAHDLAREHHRDCLALQRDRLIADLEDRMGSLERMAETDDQNALEDDEPDRSFFKGCAMAERTAASALRKTIAKHKAAS